MYGCVCSSRDMFEFRISMDSQVFQPLLTWSWLSRLSLLSCIDMLQLPYVIVLEGNLRGKCYLSCRELYSWLSVWLKPSYGVFEVGLEQYSLGCQGINGEKNNAEIWATSSHIPPTGCWVAESSKVALIQYRDWSTTIQQELSLENSNLD